MTVEANTWDELREMRKAGKRPGSALIVTSNPKLVKNLGDCLMVILHRAGERMPVELLEGLDVIFYFDTCGIAEKVWHLCKQKTVMLASARAWCSCSGVTTVSPMDCGSYGDAMDWLDGYQRAS